MSNLIEIQSQIEKLQKQASEIKAREFDKTVQDILAKMQAFGITLKDLQPGKARGAIARTRTALAKSASNRVAGFSNCCGIQAPGVAATISFARSMAPVMSASKADIIRWPACWPKVVRKKSSRSRADLFRKAP